MNTQPEIELSEEQHRVMEAFRAGRNMLVTGSAGTGKSTLLRAMVEHANGRLPVTATTGIAAVNVGGMTIHSWSGVGIAQEAPHVLAQRIVETGGEPLNRIRGYNRLAIDEISMMSRQLFDKLDEVFRIVRKVPGRPFGGMQLAMFGDFLQLPPVTKDEKEDINRFCFSSEAWHAANVQTHLLTKVFRQEDASFSSALNDIRLGNLTTEARALLNGRCGKPEDTMPGVKAVTVFTHNIDVDAHNLAQLGNLEGDLKTYDAIDSGAQPQIDLLRKNCLAPTLLELKVGAQVMLLKNLDPLSGFANGSIGVVTGFNGRSKLPEVKFANGCTKTLDSAKWEIKDAGRVLATRHQIPLRLAWAITVHKSQGMTLDKIEVFLDRVFEDGQAYVALSRARTLGGLFIRSGGRAAIRANREALDFYGA